MEFCASRGFSQREINKIGETSASREGTEMSEWYKNKSPNWLLDHGTEEVLVPKHIVVQTFPVLMSQHRMTDLKVPDRKRAGSVG